MMPDYSTWIITMGQYVADFEKEQLEGGKGADIASGYSQWVQYDDGQWYYVTQGGEQFRAIARAFLCEGCDADLYTAQPDAFKKYKWNSDVYPYTTMPAGVPVLMPQAAVDQKTKNDPASVPATPSQWQSILQPVPIRAAENSDRKVARGLVESLLITLGLAGLIAGGLWYWHKKTAPESNPSEMQLYQINDGDESVTLDEFLSDNRGLDPEDVEKIRSLKVEEVGNFGGGAWAEWKIRRVY